MTLFQNTDILLVVGKAAYVYILLLEQQLMDVRLQTKSHLNQRTFPLSHKLEKMLHRVKIILSWSKKTHTSLVSSRRNKPGCDVTEHGVPSGGYSMNFYKKVKNKVKITPDANEIGLVQNDNGG